MDLSRRSKRRLDSITIFVSLALCLLVLFTYLNASALPSKKILSQAVTNAIATPAIPHEREVGIPNDLLDAVRYFKTNGRSAARPGVIESSILIDRRGLQYENQGGLDEKKISKLFAWMTDEKRDADFTAEVTCFITDPDSPGNLGGTLYQREQRCRTLNIFNREKILPNFSARTVPKDMQQLVSDKKMSIDDLILVTLKRQHGNS